MPGRLLFWLLLSYVALDLGNPLVHGAVSLTADGQLEWVEAVSHESGPRLAAQVAHQGPALSGPSAPVVVASLSARRPVIPWRAWLAWVRTGDPPARDHPSGPEDH